MDLVKSTDKKLVCILLRIASKVRRRHPHSVEEATWAIGCLISRVKLYAKHNMKAF
jgi:hypothetical protein